MLIGKPKPDGSPYTNTDADWRWLAGDAGKAARWLGYVPFDQVTDQRNSPPIIRIFTEPEPTPWLHVGLHVEIPGAEDLLPEVNVEDFTGTQPFKLVMFGEKSSLDAVLAPLAESYKADLYLPTGEISDTLLHKMASVGAADGRPMVVLTFSDSDPSGWQMSISIGRKLQAFKTAFFPALEFQVHRVGLTPDQVRTYGLPSTPLKDTERRADKWRDKQGVQQTEIDALIALRPDLLRQIAEDALRAFFDDTLSERVWRAEQEWRDEAQAVVEAQLDDGRLQALRITAAEKLDAMRREIDQLNNALRIDLDDFTIPVPVIPSAEITNGHHPLPLLDSGWSFAQQCRALIASKAYTDGGESA